MIFYCGTMHTYIYMFLKWKWKCCWGVAVKEGWRKANVISTLINSFLIFLISPDQYLLFAYHQYNQILYYRYTQQSERECVHIVWVSEGKSQIGRIFCAPILNCILTRFSGTTLQSSTRLTSSYTKLFYPLQSISFSFILAVAVCNWLSLFPFSDFRLFFFIS